MTGYALGMDPTRVYSETEVLQGKCPGLGTMVSDSAGKVYRCVKVTTGNIIKGTLLQITASDTVVVGPSAPAGLPSSGPLCVAVNSATASASQVIFAQMFGLCQVLASASGNYTVGLPLKPGATPGNVEQGVTSASAYIAGMTVHALTTVSAVVSLISVFLNYPKLVTG